MRANYDKTTALVYHNDFLMRKIIGNVEQFKDRNSLELTSRRLRELCLTTPITLRKTYAIRSEDKYFPSLFHLLGHPRRSWSRLTISTCSDTPEEEKTEILAYTWKNLSGNGEVFFDGVRKRLLNQITEFESTHRFSWKVLQNLQRFPKLNRIIVHNARGSLDESEADEELKTPFLERIESLDLVLNRDFCIEIAKIKRLIGPNLKDFSCQINPIQSRNQWFIEEIMVEMAIQNVKLNTCRLHFPNSLFPRHLVVAICQFMAERTEKIQVSMGGDVIRTLIGTVPAIRIQFSTAEDETLKLLVEACPMMFQKAEIVKITDIFPENVVQIVEMMPKLYSVREMMIGCTHHRDRLHPIDQIIGSLPLSLRSLHLDNCKMTPSSIDYLIIRNGKSLENLKLTRNGSCNTSTNFLKILEGFPELRNLKVDMTIPHLMFKKIVEHRNLRKLEGVVKGTPPEQNMQILRQHFRHVILKKVDRHKQNLIISDRIS
ncbi:hypothetical protein GCK72_017328 [Caenorhabditis remanei]|uniref:F-box domain-containing protein n=1 Tax=Caenorhabditis remanei TaxID=31234 RepID=A0A6A5G706_CAERE|nr:hypothetical protein GCK72_017328 [Caenorhabditis remanei]KAF1750777.1 hypothetical protein GCK72_017328 [Caenorhabditis remanei]